MSDNDSEKSPEKNDPDNQGSMKWLTNKLRTGSKILDYVPLGIEEIGVAALTGLAGAIDSAACLIKGDTHGAAREAACGVAETAAAALPFAEYAKVVGVDVRDMARGGVSKLFNKASGADSKTARAPGVVRPRYAPA